VNTRPGGEEHLHYHIHVEDVNDLPKVEQALQQDAQRDENTGSGYGSQSTISADQQRDRPRDQNQFNNGFPSDQVIN
jgi:hypothetical protein